MNVAVVEERRVERRGYWFAAWFVIGLLLGIVVVNGFIRAGLLVDIESVGLQQYIANVTATKNVMISYIVEHRILQFIGFFLFLYFVPRKYHVFMLSLFLGFLFGISVSLEVLNDGIKGILYYVLGILPQGILYGLVFFLGVLKQNVCRKGKATLIMIVLWLFGVALECNVNFLFIFHGLFLK